MTLRRLSLLAALAGLPLVAGPAQALISFGPPLALNSTASGDSEVPDADDVDREVSLANDGAGTWVAVWSSDNSLSGTVGDDFDILFQRSTDDGDTWTAAAPLYSNAASDGMSADTQPRVAYADGAFVVAFTSTNTLGDTVGIDNDILVSRSTNGGASFSNPILLNSGGSADDTLEIDGQTSLAVDGDGNILAVWKHQTLGGMNPTADQINFSYSTDGGATWAAEQPLGGPQTANIGLGQGNAAVAVPGGFVAAWGSTENLGSNGTDGDILYATISVPGFTASPAAVLHSSAIGDAGADTFPTLVEYSGALVAAWASTSDVFGAGTDGDILFALSGDDGSTWTDQGLLNDNGGSDTGTDRNPSGISDGTITYVVWESTDDLGKTIKTDSDILFVYSTPGKAPWSSPSPLASTAVKDKGSDEEPAIAVNTTSNTWIVAWESTDSLGKSIGVDEDVLYVRASEECPSAPVSAAGCFQTSVPGKSSLTIKEAGTKDSFSWKLVKGEAIDKAMDFGNPLGSDDYVLCVYDETADVAELVTELDLPAGGNCYTKPCWTDVPTGYLYKHKFGSASGATFGAGIAGKSKASVKAKGAFRAPALPLSKQSTVSVRLHNLGNGKCLAADFSTAVLNDGALFKATSD